MEANLTYYIEVKHYGGGTGSFTLVVEECELSNDENELINLEVGQPYIDTLDAETHDKWYCFIPEMTGSYQITSQGETDIQGTVYDSTKSNMVFEGVEKDGNFVLAGTLLGEQEYYIKVESDNLDKIYNEYSLYIERFDLPNDEHFMEQWALFNINSGVDINIIPAWQLAQNNKFMIGIADTGTYYEHEDLKNNIDTSLMYNFTHDMVDVFPLDEKVTNSSAQAGHGTHVTGIIGAEKDNEAGIVGIMPNATIVPLKVLGSKITDYPIYNGSIKAFVNAIDYAKANGIKIINCSFGGSTPKESEQEAMLAAEEILFVIAAGNSGANLEEEPEYPACYYNENAIVVAAIGETGELSEFSNYGGPTEIAAPGEDIISTYPYDDYTYNTGTSMAAPIVSGVCGLIWSQDESLSSKQVKEIVIDNKNVTKIESLNNQVNNGGVVNAFKAISSLDRMNTEREEQSIYDGDALERKVFQYDIKSTINYYKENATEEEKTDRVIIKLDEESEIEEIIEKLEDEYEFEYIGEYEYLELIDVYIIRFVDIYTADSAVDILNGFDEVIYAEPDYSRSLS